MSESAEELLAGLDPDQRAIAECLRGPVVVLAGAGTGKTRTITHRIAYGVRSGVYAPERVLAVTFTRKAVGELQGRLRGLGVTGVNAQTFHGAALAQLGHFWPEIVGGPAPQVLSGKVATVAQAAESLGIRLRPETLRDVAAEIEWRKVSMLGLESYARALQTRAVPHGVTAEQLLDLHAAYGALLADRRQIDFEDVLVLATGLLESEPRAAVQLRERYRFFTVDEYQDVSPLQHALLRVWLGDRTDVCVVGDASQTIYTFAGASSSFLLRFRGEHPGAREFRLERNYRSAAPVVTLANRLMRDRPGALTLRAMREGASSPPSVEWFATEQEEAAAVAGSVRAAIDDGTPASEIAVLARTNIQSARVEEELVRHGISSRTHGSLRFFERAEVRQAVMLIRGQAKVRDDRPLFQVVSDLLRSCGWSTTPPEGAAGRERWEALNAILSLVDESAPGARIAAFSDELQDRARVHHEPALDAVTLSAIHSAKGLEWTLVHLIGMSEGLLPLAHARDEEALDEERRLCYVAITRAREVLRLSGSASAARAPRHPSRFIQEAGLRVPTGSGAVRT